MILLIPKDPDVAAAMQPNGDLYDLGWYLWYSPLSNTATLDGDFTADHLESIAAYMRVAQEGNPK